MNEADWIEELDHLRDEAPVAHRVRVRTVVAEDEFFAPAPLVVLTGMGPRGIEAEGRQDVALYAADAQPGDLPLVIVPVSPHVDLGDVKSGGTVLVRGVPRVGHGVVLEVGGRLVATGPGTVPTLFRHRWALQ